MTISVSQSFFIDSSGRIASGDVSGKEGGQGKGGSWFEALAAALGGILGARVDKLMTDMNTMHDSYKETLDPTSGEQQSKAYMDAMTDFQVQSQMFGMESQAASTAIKSIGDGLSSLARKQ